MMLRSIRVAAFLSAAVWGALSSAEDGKNPVEVGAAAATLSDSFSAALHASLHRILSEAGMPNPLRAERQRPIDPRLLKIESVGWEASGLFPGKVHQARNAKEVQALSGRLEPGDQLALTGTAWKDVRFTFAGHGTAQAPILVRPERPGSVVFGGDSRVAFHGEHLVVMGLEFRDGVVSEKNTVIFRLGYGAEKPANHCIVNRIRMENCNSASPSEWPEVRMWLLNVQGKGNTIANSVFAELKNFGQMLAAGELPADGLLGLHILNNRFLDRPKIDNQNGYEIIQIGGSGEMARPSGVLIQGNTFENCNGENEILTLKTSDVFVRCNTFSGCKGVLSLRMGDRMLVQRNLFDGNGRSNTGGVGVEGAGHVIIENTFRHLRAPRNYHFWPLLMACASSEKTGDDRQGYGRVKNVLIAENYFDHNDARIAVGTYPRPEYPLLPKDIWVRNNVFIGTTANSPFDYMAPDPTGAMQKTIHESGNQFRP